MNPILAVALVVAALLLAGLLYQWAGVRRDAKRFPPPGSIQSGLHLHIRGRTGTPVLLEAGIAASSASWKLVAEPLSERHRVVAYDRAGFAWSAARSSPRNFPNLVEDLREALDSAGISEPAVLVGHSFGGLLLRHFAARYPERVAGMVLADPLMPFEWHPISSSQAARLARGVMLSRRGATLARIGFVRLAMDLLLGGSIALPKVFAKVSGRKASTVTDRIVGELRKLPPELWPVLQAHWCLPRSFRTLAEYLERLPSNCAEPLNHESLSDVPLVVISAESAGEDVVKAHRTLAAASRRGVHLMAPGCGHWVQLDRPDLIVEAVERLCSAEPGEGGRIQ